MTVPSKAMVDQFQCLSQMGDGHVPISQHDKCPILSDKNWLTMPGISGGLPEYIKQIHTYKLSKHLFTFCVHGEARVRKPRDQQKTSISFHCAVCWTEMPRICHNNFCVLEEINILEDVDLKLWVYFHMICINLLGGQIFILLLSSGTVAGLPHHHFRGRAPQTCPPLVRMTYLCEHDPWDTWEQVPSTALWLALAYRNSSKTTRNTQHIFQTKRQHFQTLSAYHWMSAVFRGSFLNAAPTFTESGQCAAASSDKPAWIDMVGWNPAPAPVEVGRLSH